MRSYDDISKDLQGINGENYTEKALALLDDVKQLTETLTALKLAADESEKKLNELREVNAKLYLRATDEIDEPDEDNELTLDDILKEMKE